MMTPLPLLAADFDPGQLGLWMMIAFFVLHGVGTIKTLFTKNPSLPELATKKELEGYVRQAQFNEFRMEVRGDVAEIKAMITGSVSKVEDYAEKSYLARKDIHKQVNGIDKQLTKVETRQDEQGKQITEIQRHG